MSYSTALCTLLLSLLLPCAALGQRDSLTQLAAGLRAGYSLNQMSLSPLRNQTWQSGLEGALVLRYFNQKIVGVQVEMGVAQGGWRETPDSVQYYARTFSLLSVQMMTQVALGRGRVRPLLQAGPYFGVPLTETEESSTGFVPPRDNSYYGAQQVMQFNYGLTVGLGANISIGSVALQPELRYVQGLNSSLRGGLGLNEAFRQAISAHLSLLWAW